MTTATHIDCIAERAYQRGDLAFDEKTALIELLLAIQNASAECCTIGNGGYRLAYEGTELVIDDGPVVHVRAVLHEDDEGDHEASAHLAERRIYVRDLDGDGELFAGHVRDLNDYMERRGWPERWTIIEDSEEGTL